MPPGRAKPSKLAFERACAGLGTRPAETVMIGDDPDKDITAALNAGLRAIHIAPGQASPSPYQVGSLTEAGLLIAP
ncbi:MAG: HAD family hydrolase [Propionicimonas sp.]